MGITLHHLRSVSRAIAREVVAVVALVLVATIAAATATVAVVGSGSSAHISDVGSPFAVEAPSVQIASPAALATVADRFLVAGVVRGSGDIVRLEVAMDDGPWRSLEPRASWDVELDGAVLSPGVHRLRVRAVDGHGQKAIAMVAVVAP